MLDFILNFVFAWLSVFCIIMTLIKVIFRILAQKTNVDAFKKINISLMKTHFMFGNLAIFFGLVHGLYSSESLFSINLGTIALLIIILLKVSFSLRKVSFINKLWLKIHQVLSITLIVITILHVIDVGGINIFNEFNSLNSSEISTTNTNNDKEQSTTNSSKEETTTTESSETSEDDSKETSQATSKYKDGTYTGVADAYGPDLTVEVTIKDDVMTNIEIVSHNEVGEHHYQKAFDNVVAEILESQSTDVDTVSRATFTSNGIMNAVQAALDKAEN